MATSPVSVVEAKAPTGEAQKKDWTVLLYIAAHLKPDDAFGPEAEENLNELRLGRSSDDVNLVAQLDRSRFRPTVRYFFSGDRKKNRLEDFRVELRPNVDTTKASVLADFLKWGKRTYPAKNQILVLNGHGLATGILFDYKGGYLSVTDLRTAIEQGKDRFAILGMDSCLMAMLEVGYELRNCADILIASQSETVTPGWFYTNLAKDLKERKYSSEQIATRIVTRYQKSEAAQSDANGTTLSAVHLGEADTLTNAFKALVTAMQNALSDPNRVKAIHASRAGARHFVQYARRGELDHGFVDLGSFCQRLRDDPGSANSPLRAGCQLVLEALKRYVLVAKTAEGDVLTREGVRGVSIFFPAPAEGMSGRDEEEEKARLANLRWFNVSYRNLEFVRNTGWGAFLQDYLTSSIALPKDRVRTWSEGRSEGVKERISKLREQICEVKVCCCEPAVLAQSSTNGHGHLGPDSPRLGPDSPRLVADVAYQFEGLLGILEEQDAMIQELNRRLTTVELNGMASSAKS